MYTVPLKVQDNDQFIEMVHNATGDVVHEGFSKYSLKKIIKYLKKKNFYMGQIDDIKKRYSYISAICLYSDF